MKQHATRLFGYFHRSKLFSLVCKLLLSIAAFWLALHRIDFAVLGDMIAQQDKAMLAAAFALVATQTVLGATRWRLILTALAGRVVISLADIFRFYYIGVFFSSCLPGTVGGDVVRVWLAKSDHVPIALSINSVIIDRLIALISLALLAMAVLPMLGGISFDAWAAWGLAAVACVVGVWILGPLERWLGAWQHWRLMRWLLHFVHCLRLMFAHPRASIASLIVSIVSHMTLCAAVYALAMSLGVKISLLQCFGLVPPVMLLATLPISFGGWGVREASMVGMLGLAGVTRAAALAMSIQLGLIGILVSLPGGLLWLASRKPPVAESAILP